MGNCPSSFRAQFSPNRSSNNVNGTADIVMKSVDEDDVDEAYESRIEDAKSPDGDNATEEDLVPLIVEFLDLCVNENIKVHHTNCFHAARPPISKLIVRRGAAFVLNLVFNRSYNPDDDILCLSFTLKDASNPSSFKGTQVKLFVKPPTSDDVIYHDEWRVGEITSDENSVRIQIVPAANAIVGEWILEVNTKNKKFNEAPDFHYKDRNPIILLFNPWCKEDTVYLPEEELRNEYVLCDSGLIWRGCHNRLRSCIWNYGQFEENVLECALYILTNVGRLPIVKCFDPIKVVRHLSAVINSRDDNGVLVGNWSGNYKGGQCPTSWCGSQTILQKYYKTKKPVKYGQCWVFSGVFTSVCRALGIPSRTVTTFSSAHDTHGSLTVDYFFDRQGKPVEEHNIDSVWNFHVWTEAWMSRPDLESGRYDGWQAVDSTPQEKSNDVYQCGPASVVAIKRGEIMKAFDTEFLYTEVNADKVYWRFRGPKQPPKFVKKATEEIGLCISTKAVGKYEREDITHEYKHFEGSKEERDVMLRALRQCKNNISRCYLNDDLEYVKFDFYLLDDILIGQPFTVTLKASSRRTDDKVYTINVCLRVESALYTGCLKKLVKRDDFETELGPGASQEMTMKLEYSDYQKLLSDQGNFIVTAAARVKETGFEYCAQDDFRVRMPDINVQVNEEVTENVETMLTAFFTNPLPKSLTCGIFTIEGPAFGNPITLKCKGAVKIGEDARVVCKLKPHLSGSKVIAVKFHSKELQDVDGYAEIFVKQSVEEKEKEKEKDNNSHL